VTLELVVRAERGEDLLGALLVGVSLSQELARMIAVASASANARLLETTRRTKGLLPLQLRIVPAELSSQTAWPSRVAVGCVPQFATVLRRGL
jgi:hypothetical protein